MRFQVHQQALARRHLGDLLLLLCADRELRHRLQRVDEMHALGQLLVGDLAEERRHAHVPGLDRRDRARHRDEQHEQDGDESDAAEESE
jgi:hypothetical protein